jgi:hypothetical protein
VDGNTIEINGVLGDREGWRQLLGFPEPPPVPSVGTGGMANGLKWTSTQ